jgi:hypothetical protein
MRKSLAYFLRKLADFADPRIQPSPEPIKLMLSCDAAEAVESIREVQRELEKVLALRAQTEQKS